MLLKVSRTYYALFHQQTKHLLQILENIKIGTTVVHRNSNKFPRNTSGWTSDVGHAYKMYMMKIVISPFYAIKSLTFILPKDNLKTLYCTLMCPHIIYGTELWGSASKKLINKLNIMLRKAVLEGFAKPNKMTK